MDQFLCYILAMQKALFVDLKLFLSLAFVAVLLILLDNFKFLTIPKGVAQFITTPIQFGLYKTSLGVGKQLEFVILARTSAQQNKALQEQLAYVLSENANLRRKLAESESFLNQQNSLSPKNFTLLAARPLGISRYLLIDRGSDDGVKQNQVVIYKDNYIGKIIDVSPKKSKIMLVSDPDSRLAAFASNQNGKARGVLSGQFGTEMILDKILHQEPIQKNDLIYSEGIETEIPRGLILGTVSEVKDRENQVFKQAIIKTVFDVANLDVVFVITN